MKESVKKLARGQMVYAPITSAQSRSRSPFSQSKKSLTNPKPQLLQQQPFRSSNQRIQHSPQSPLIGYENTISLKNSPSPFHQFQQQLNMLARQNADLKARQEIYISKLLKLQQGLERQHEQFMNLQELYNQLFNVYKQKQEEIAQLDLRYRQTQRSRIDFGSHGKKQVSPLSADKISSVLSAQKMNSIKQSFLQQNFKHEISQLIYQNKRLNETNQKLISELNYIKSKKQLHDSRANLEQKVWDEINDWQKQADIEKEQKIKLEYENKFLKMRNEDLEKTISELQKIVAMKQSQIIKMRQEKFAHRRQSSEKVLGRSPPKANMDSARSKGSNQENQKFVKLIENLQKENHRLRQENLALKEKVRSSLLHKDINLKLSDSFYSSGSQNYMIPQKRLQFSENDSKNFNHTRNYQNQNFNSQNINQQYFSFSRERQDRESQDLPSFPMDLQIQGLIKKHQQEKSTLIQMQGSNVSMVSGSV